MLTHGHQPHRDNEASLLEVLDEGNCVLFEVGQAAVDGLGVIIRSSLLLSSFVQPLLQTVVGAGKKHHQVRGANLVEHMISMKCDSHGHVNIHLYFMFTMVLMRELSLKAAKQ